MSRSLIVTFASCFFAAAVPGQEEEAKPAGFVIVKDSLVADFSTSRCLEFSAYEETAIGIGIRTTSGEKLSLRKGMVEQPVYYFDFSTKPITSSFDIETVKRHGRLLLRYSENFPITRELVDKEVERIKVAIERFRSGERLLNGKWVSQEELENQITLRSVKGLPSLAVNGRTYRDVSAVDQEGLRVRIRHTGGMSLISVDELTREQVAALNEIETPVRLVYYDLEAMEKEVKELVAQTRESVSTIESRLEEKAEDLLSEAGEEKKRLEAEAVQMREKTASDLQKERLRVQNELVTLSETSLLSDVDTPIFQTVAESLQDVGQRITFFVNERMDRSRTSINRRFSGDSAYVVTMPDESTALLAANATLFQSEGQQTMHLRQVGMADYQTEAGFKNRAPVFIPATPEAITKSEELEKEVSPLIEKARLQREKAKNLRERITQIESAFRSPTESPFFQESNSLFEQAKSAFEKAKAEADQLSDPETPDRKRIAILQAIIEETQNDFEQLKKELEATRPSSSSEIPLNR